LSPDGHSPSGWPYRPAGQLIGPCLDSECFGGHGAPAFGPDGTVYLVFYDPDSAAPWLDRYRVEGGPGALHC